MCGSHGSHFVHTMSSIRSFIRPRILLLQDFIMQQVVEIIKMIANISTLSWTMDIIQLKQPALYLLQLWSMLLWCIYSSMLTIYWEKAWFMFWLKEAIANGSWKKSVGKKRMKCNLLYRNNLIFCIYFVMISFWFTWCLCQSIINHRPPKSWKRECSNVWKGKRDKLVQSVVLGAPHI